VGVEVVRDVPHVLVDAIAVLAEPFVSDDAQHREQVRTDVVGWIVPVLAPHDHGDLADLAVRDPAPVVFEVPGRESLRLTEIAARRVDRYPA
jgi:hypothetical protein